MAAAAPEWHRGQSEPVLFTDKSGNRPLQVVGNAALTLAPRPPAPDLSLAIARRPARTASRSAQVIGQQRRRPLHRPAIWAFGGPLTGGLGGATEPAEFIVRARGQAGELDSVCQDEPCMLVDLHRCSVGCLSRQPLPAPVTTH